MSYKPTHKPLTLRSVVVCSEEMASVLMKTFPVAFRSLIASSTSRLQLYNNTYRTFEQLGSPSVMSVTPSPCSSTSAGMSGMVSRVQCYSSCTCSSLKEHCLSHTPGPKCYSLNGSTLSGLSSIKGRQRFAHRGPCRSLSLGVPVSKKREL